MPYSDSVLVLYSYTPGEVPSAGDMQRPGRFAINYADGKLFYLGADGFVKQITVPTIVQGLTADGISDASAIGKSVLRATDASTIRMLLGLVIGNAAGNLVALASAGKLPALDGSALTNLPTSGGLSPTNNNTVLGNVSGASAVPVGLTATQLKNLLALVAADIGGLGTAATLNAGNAVGNLVQVLTGGKLPVLDGSNLTNLPTSGGGLAGNVKVANVTTSFNSTNTGFVDVPGLSLTITPSATTSRIKLDGKIHAEAVTASNAFSYRLLRGATVVDRYQILSSNGGTLDADMPISVVDSPATTTSTTYKVQVASPGGTTITVYGTDFGYGPSSLIATEIGA